MGGKLTVAVAVVPSAKLAVTVKLAPPLNGVGVRSDANTKKAPPSAGLPGGAPALADRGECGGRGGRRPAGGPVPRRAKRAATVRRPPPLNGVGVRSDANTKKAPPSATAKLTVPLPAFRSAPS